eukprot:scaffold1014_cov260-Pinguiococcus_pyrenoidosus.AAC.12
MIEDGVRRDEGLRSDPEQTKPRCLLPFCYLFATAVPRRFGCTCTRWSCGPRASKAHLPATIAGLPACSALIDRGILSTWKAPCRHSGAPRLDCQSEAASVYSHPPSRSPSRLAFPPPRRSLRCRRQAWEPPPRTDLPGPAGRLT